MAIDHRQVETDALPAQPTIIGDNPHLSAGGIDVNMGILRERAGRTCLAMPR